MTKTMRKETTFSFPRGPMALGKAVAEAELALEADYMADVNGVAEALGEKLKKGELGSSVGQLTALENMLERHPRCTLERKAAMGLLVSKNSSAAFDEGADVECDDELPYADVMWHAMRRDVLEALDAQGIDVSDIEAAIADEGESDDDEDHDVDEDEADNE